MIEIKLISKEQKKRILHLEEGHFYDHKSKDISPSKLTKTISAFSNSDGGELYIGIEESKKINKSTFIWKGFNKQEEANGHIQGLYEFFPLGLYFSYSFLQAESDNTLVLHISVNKTKEIYKASDGIPYIRMGAQNLPVKSHEELKRLELDKGIISFESQTINIEKELITESGIIINFITKVIPSSSPEDWLKKQLLLRDGKPSVGGSLLFMEIPQAALPKQCGIKIYRYRTKESEGNRLTLAFDPVTIEGCLYNQIYDAVKTTIEFVEDIKYLGVKSLEYITYPKETLHEIITNAVIHRDYSIQTDIHIRIFDNRIEIESPGKLPGHITVENILKEQLARNGTIVRIINKFPNPPNKDIGEGLDTAFEAMKKLRLKEPQIIENANSVLVIIKHESLASPEEMVVEYLKKNKEINNTKGRELTGISSENSMKSVFKRLQERQIIEPKPGRKGSAFAWQLKNVDLLFEQGTLKFDS